MPPGDFLLSLDLTDDERRKLSALDLTSPRDLAHRIKASPKGLRDLIGDNDRADRVERALVALLSPEDRASLESPPPPRFALGANAGAPPRLADPPHDLARRDALFRELQTLRAAAGNDDARRRRIGELERELDALVIGKPKSSNL